MDCRPKSIYSLRAGLQIFGIDFAGRVAGNYIDPRLDMIGVALAFLAMYCHLYYLAHATMHRAILSAMMFYVLLQAFKEIALDPTRTYPAEIISIIPVAYSVITERKRLKALQH